jgi:hypothetical protein
MIPGILGVICGLLAGVFLLVGLIPLLGWLNWFTSLPTAIVGLLLSAIGARGKQPSKMAIVGCILNGIVLAVAAFRLVAGGGIL